MTVTKHNVLTKEEAGNVVMKHEDNNVLTDSSVLTKGEVGNALTKLEDEDSNAMTQNAVTVLTEDEDFTVLEEDSNVLTKDEGENTTALTKDEDINVLMKLPKAFSISDYKAYWTKHTHWERSLQQATTKDNNVLNKAFSTRSKNFRRSMIAILLLLSISISISFYDRSPPKFIGDANYVCKTPQITQPWQITAFRPRWFGLFGRPRPITYKTKGGRGHRVSIVDMDKRDIEIEMWVDDKDFGYRPVVLDNAIDCGDDLTECLKLGFGAAMITIPPGKHIVQAQILDTQGTFRWGDERRRRVWWMVEQCS